MLLSDHHDVAPRVKRYFCAHLPAPSARGVIRGEQQQQQEAKSAAITKFFFALLPPGTSSLGSLKSLVRCNWTHAVENVTYIATVAVVRPRARIHTWVARKKEKIDLQTQCVIYVSNPLLRISLYRILSFMWQNKTPVKTQLNKTMPLYQL